MTRRNRIDRGFTIIEVILFVAISGLLMIAAFTTIQGRTEAAQYTDSTRDLQGYIERKVAQIRAGSIIAEADCRYIKSGSASPGTYSGLTSDGTCIFLGYMFRLDPARLDEIDVYQVYGAGLATNDPCVLANPADPLFCADPRLTPIGNPQPIETYTLRWGGEVRDRWGGNTTSQYFGYLRDPFSQDIIPVSFFGGQEGNLDQRQVYRQSYAQTMVGSEFSGQFCLEINGKDSALVLGEYDRQFSVDAYFDDIPGTLIC